MKIRDKAILNLGGKCKNCGTTEKLHLHHIKRLPLSVLSSEKNEYNKRAKEAFEHPERFNLLCKKCHSKHHDDKHVERMSKKYNLVLKEDKEEIWENKKTGALLHATW